MELTPHCFSHLGHPAQLGPPVAQKAQEKETYEEAFNRLWSDIGQLTEDEFQARLIELVRIGDEQPEISDCCADGSCDLCTWLDWLNSSPSCAGSAPLDHQGKNQPFAACYCAGFCTCHFDTVSE